MTKFPTSELSCQKTKSLRGISVLIFQCLSSSPVTSISSRLLSSLIELYIYNLHFLMYLYININDYEDHLSLGSVDKIDQICDVNGAK